MEAGRKTSFPGSAWERQVLQAVPALRSARQSLASGAFPGRAWERPRRATRSRGFLARRGGLGLFLGSGLRRRGGGGFLLGLDLLLALLQELEDRGLAGVAEASSVQFHDARVAAGAVLEARADFGEEFLDHVHVDRLALVVPVSVRIADGAHAGNSQAPGVQRALLRERDELLDERTHFLGLHQRRGDAAVLRQNQRPRQVAKQSQAMSCASAEGAAGVTMSHDHSNLKRGELEASSPATGHALAVCL